MQEKALAEKYLIFKCISGSHAYGMSTETSDFDTRGVFIAPPEYIIGVKKTEQVEDKVNDCVIYELRKFVKLAMDANPSIIELLFTEDENILFEDEAFTQLQEQRHLFLSKKVKHTFSGYAMAQLKRVKGHKKWINNPKPVDPPNLLDYAKIYAPHTLRPITEKEQVEEYLKDTFLWKITGTVYRICQHKSFTKPAISEDGTQVRHLDCSIDRLAKEIIRDKGVFVVSMEKFQEDTRDWQQYWNWKKNRNPVRAELEAKMNYDSKHVSHLVRLLRMGEEILSTGKVIIRRPDAQELLEIRNGKLTYDEVLAWAKEQDAKLNELYETSSLPFSPEREAINRLYMEVVKEFWRRHHLV